MFRVETPRELANWSRNLVQGAHDAASLIKEINCGKKTLESFRSEYEHEIESSFPATDQ